MAHFRSKKLIDAAEGKPCVICRSMGTTVSAHANFVEYGKGRGIKAPDYFVAWLCYACHYNLDHGTIWSKQEKWEMWHRAYARTVEQWFKLGLVVVK